MKVVLVFLVVLVVCVVGKDIIYVDLMHVPSEEQASGQAIAALAIGGLQNRHGPNVYFNKKEYDDFWWRELLMEEHTKKEMDLVDFVKMGLTMYPVIVYESGPLDTLPAVITLCGVKSAIPITTELLKKFNVPAYKILMDTRGMWPSADESIQYVTNCCLNQTTSLAMQGGDRLWRGQLVDWIVQQKLFTQYLKKQCIPFTSVKDDFNGAIKASNWEMPVKVYGYNALDVVFGGDLFEAETDCNRHLGQIASADTSNLAFWSQYEQFLPNVPQGQHGGPLKQKETKYDAIKYNNNKTYVALVYGDMDNLDFVQTFGTDHMKTRREVCKASPKNCFPLTWTMSPNLINVAPAILRWYYANSMMSGNDRFIMPPSGSLYSYPGIMPSEVQTNYVNQQNYQAYIMNTTGSIHWEWLFTWGEAWTRYFPRYINGPGTRFFFLNDVPWKIPIPGMTFLYRENYRIIDDGPRNFNTSVIGFRPAFNWQYNGPSGGDPGNATHIAGRVNNLKIGSIQYVYIIQSTPVDMVFDMVSQLDNHVEVVNHEQLADLALQHHRFHKFDENEEEMVVGGKGEREEREEKK